jgi:hypothetical protein
MNIPRVPDVHRFRVRRVFLQGRVKGAFSTQSDRDSAGMSDGNLNVRRGAAGKFGRNFFNPEKFSPRAVYCAVRSFSKESDGCRMVGVARERRSARSTLSGRAADGSRDVDVEIACEFLGIR